MCTPLVSIIIPTYKRANMLKRAIMSACRQTYQNIEIIVISDNEPDDEFTQFAQQTVKAISDNRIRFITQKKHKNGAVARNVGIRESQGEYITFIDDDDYIDSEKIAKQVTLLQSLDKTWGGVCCRYKVYRKGCLVEVMPLFKSGYVYKDIIMRLIKTQTNSLLLRKEALLDSGLFDENLKRHQDIQLLARFTYKYKLYCQDEFLNNLDQDDNQNRLKPKEIIALKKAFFNSVNDILDSFSTFDKYRLKLLTQFDIGALYFINGDKLKGLKKCLSILLSPVATYMAIKKIRDKWSMRKLAKEMQSSGKHLYLAE